MKFGTHPFLKSRLAIISALVLCGIAISALSGSSAGAQSPALTHAAQSIVSSQQPYQLPPDKLPAAVFLGWIRPILHFGSEAWQILALTLLLTSGMASHAAHWSKRYTQSLWKQSAIMSTVLALFLFLAVDLPFAATNHAVSLRYGISIENWPAWLLDESKYLFLRLLLEVPLLMLVFGLTLWRWSQRHFWFWFATATVPLILIGTFLLPEVIEPFFDTFEPLSQSHPALVAQLERVAERTGNKIPPDRMYLMKASSKSNGLNAYVTGFGASKRIVIWDTTADRMPLDEILFTFAHETGHCNLNHIPKGIALAVLGTFLICWAVAQLAKILLARFGVNWNITSIRSLEGLVVLLLSFALIQALTEPIGNGISRAFEHEADVYGEEAIHGIVPSPQQTAVGAFNQIGAAYLDDPNPNAFIAFWAFDHPSTQSRAQFAIQYDPWVPNQHPHYFLK